MDRDGVAMARDAEPGQVSDHRVVGRQPPFPRELEDGDRGERLADRPDLEQGAAGDRPAGRDVAQAGHAAGQQTVTIGHREGEARHRAVGPVVDEGVVQGSVECGVGGSDRHGPPIMPARPPGVREGGPVRSGTDEWRPGWDYRPGAAPADPDASLGAPARDVAGRRPPLGNLLAAHPTCDCRVHRGRHRDGLRLCCDDPAATATDRRRQRRRPIRT